MKTNNITEEILIDYIEGNLTDAEEEALNVLIEQNSHLQKEIAFLRKTFVSPEEEIIFPDRSALKKTRRFRLPAFAYTSAAVAAMVIAGFFFLKPTPPTTSSPLLTDIEVNARHFPVNNVDAALSDEIKTTTAEAVNPAIKKVSEREQEPSFKGEGGSMHQSELPENLQQEQLLATHGMDVEKILPVKDDRKLSDINVIIHKAPEFRLNQTSHIEEPILAMAGDSGLGNDRSGIRRLVDSFLRIKKEEENGDPYLVIHLNTGSFKLKGTFSFNQF